MTVNVPDGTATTEVVYHEVPSAEAPAPAPGTNVTDTTESVATAIFNACERGNAVGD